MHTALSLAREDVERSGCLVQRMPRGARPRVKTRPLRRTEPASWVARPLLPPLHQRRRSRRLWQRFGDDGALIGLKITLLVGMGALAAALEWVR